MKKLVVLSFLVLAFAATSFAQGPKLDFRASGYIDMRTNLYQWNVSNGFDGGDRNGIIDVVGAKNKPNGAEWNRTESYVESRARLKFDAIMGKELSGTIFFEFDSARWGDYDGTRNSYGAWGGDRAALEVKNIYFDVAVPYIPVPITFRAGLQPFGVRASSGFWYNDGMGITAAAKLDPVTIIGYWGKMLEGNAAASDDADFYGLQVNAKISTFTIGGYGYYFALRTYPINTVAGYGTSVNSIKGDMLWLGAFLDGKLGPVNLSTDFIFDDGKLEHKMQPVSDTDYRGWLARAKLSMPWEMFEFGLVGIYGSGSNARKQGKFGVPGEGVLEPNYAAAGYTSSKVGSFVVPPGSETGSVNEGEVLFASYITGGFSGFGYTGDGARMCRGSLGGLWLARLYGSYKITPDFKALLQVVYIGDTTSNGDTFGKALTSAGGLKDGSSIGWEVDMINEWQIYKNLNFKFGGGVLFPGSALEFWNNVKLKNEKPNTPWLFQTNLTYSF